MGRAWKLSNSASVDLLEKIVDTRLELLIVLYNGDRQSARLDLGYRSIRRIGGYSQLSAWKGLAGRKLQKGVRNVSQTKQCRLGPVDINKVQEALP